MRWVVLLLGVALFLVSPVPASGHQTDVFDACAKEGRFGQPCRNQETVIGGDAVFLRAVLKPKHAGEAARVWRARPHATWTKIALTTVHPEGRIRWNWHTTVQDVHNFTSWRFRFVIPGHGQSDIVKVRVISPPT